MTKDSLPPSRTADQFVVRFPEGMRDKIAEAAKANGRSMNAEILARLQFTFGYVPEGARTLDPLEWNYQLTGEGGAVFTINADDLVERIAEALKSKFTGPDADKDLQAFQEGFTKGLDRPVAPTVEPKPTTKRIPRTKKT